MKTTEINQSIIGKRCECMFTGMMVKGIITEIEDCLSSTYKCNFLGADNKQ